MPSIFAKIVSGEVPSYKIYEDDTVLAFLDINPEAKGHTLVIPKEEIDKIYDLPDDLYTHLFAVAKKLAKNMEVKTGKRTLMKVIGTDVPHAHIHLIPQSDTWEYGKTLKLSEDEFKEIQAKLKVD